MKRKYIHLIIVSLFFAYVANAQHELYFETFNGSTNTFTINDTIHGNKSMGDNKWIVDSNYFAGGIYPKTYNEDSTFGGSITGAPYSKYLHIYDSASRYTNANYNPKDTSDGFAHMTSGICTKGMTDVTLNYFYLGEGSSSAYGLSYYSVNGGPWTQFGSTLNNKYKWQYVTLTNPAFNNVDNLQIGFKWINNNGSGKDTSSLGIDDVSIFGSYDSLTHPITCTWTNLGVDSCLGDGAYVFLEYNLSDTLCDATWDIYMSNSTGGFPGPYAWYMSIGPDYGNAITGYWYLTIPNTYSIPGHCYKFKMERTTYPFLSFEDSVCIPLDSCPGYITTLQPVVTMDTSAVCAGSVIAVTFNSTGTYKSTNIYYAELVDSIGHSAIIDTLGALPSNSSFPTLPPGSITGRIPDTVPTGCHYYVRVVSTTPNRAVYMWGPFCIQHCEILTDKSIAGWPTNVQVCLGSCYKSPRGYTDTLPFDIKAYDSAVHYSSGNEFKVQVLSGTNFSAVNTGGFGLVVDTVANKVAVHVPCADSLTSVYGMAPGVYYMRIIATNPNYHDSVFGSVVFLTIGELPDSLYLTVTPSGGTFCLGTTLTFNTNPDDQYTLGSVYTWWIGESHTTTPFAGWNQGYLGYTTSTAGKFMISVQEDNYGCMGPLVSMPDSLYIEGKPNVTVSGLSTVCLGDTILYSVPYVNNSIYDWEVYDKKATVIPGANTVKIVFDSAGTFKVTIVASDSCFTDSATKSVHVRICTGIETIHNPLNIGVYPNPSNGHFTFTFGGAAFAGDRLEVFNMLGEIVKKVEVTNSSILIDLGSSPDGLYYYRVISTDGSQAGSGKLIIDK